jgi:hypothetical protein
VLLIRPQEKTTMAHSSRAIRSLVYFLTVIECILCLEPGLLKFDAAFQNGAQMGANIPVSISHLLPNGTVNSTSGATVSVPTSLSRFFFFFFFFSSQK